VLNCPDLPSVQAERCGKGGISDGTYGSLDRQFFVFPDEQNTCIPWRRFKADLRMPACMEPDTFKVHFLLQCSL
jgi:hypothetical protein